MVGFSDPVLELFLGIVGVLLLVGLLCGFFLVRKEMDPLHRRWRFGVFVERDLSRNEEEPPWPDPERTVELPSSVREKEEK